MLVRAAEAVHLLRTECGLVELDRFTSAPDRQLYLDRRLRVGSGHAPTVFHPLARSIEPDGSGRLEWLSHSHRPSASGIGQCVGVGRIDQAPDESDDSALRAFFSAIATRDHASVTQRLEQTPELARSALRIGASRQDPRPFFLVPISHYVYTGDTALHVAGAAHQRGLAELLVARGANTRARNRRGAEPLHYAADGSPGADDWDPGAQRDVICYLVDAGADPNALDKSGVAALHRAVRTRSSGAVGALIDKGADPLLMNKSGSTPLHLAVQNTGKSNSGSDAAQDEQRRIIILLLEHGASPADVDASGKTVAAAAASHWVRQLLEGR